MKEPGRISPPMFYADAMINTGDTIEILGEEAGHILQSRRYRPGDEIILTNGRGIRAQGIIESARGNSKLTVTINQSTELPLPATRKILASALPKGDRQGIMLGMAAQLGMNAFIPLICEHSVVKYKPAMAERWRRIITAACKQSRQCHFPEILGSSSVDHLVGKQVEGLSLIHI